MIEMNCTVIRQGEPPHLWPEMDRAMVVDMGALESFDVVFLEGGTSDGNASVMFRFPTPDGHFLFMETTLNTLISAMAVARGAFPEQFADTPFADGVEPTGGMTTPGSN